MKELFKKNTLLTKIEFWAITAIFGFVLFFFIKNIFEWDDRAFADAPNKSLFDEVHIPFHFYKNYFFPYLIRYAGLYIYLLALNFVIIPPLLKKKKLIRNIILLVVVFAALILMYSITGAWIHAYRYIGYANNEINQDVFRDGFDQFFIATWLLIIYTAIKYAGIYLLAVSATIETKYPVIRKEAIIATAVWLLGLLFLRFSRVEGEFFIGWAIVIPSAIVFYLVSFYRLIPRALARNANQFFFYVLQSGIILFIAFITIYLASVFINDKDDAGAGYSAFNVCFQLFITLPITWMLYKRHLKKNNEINHLQQELGQSNAKFDFLRSQINPHFLFNALNTLYGTAIQEKADRTSEGIQMLGDMMRFMLQENMQDKISLAREINYLENYISLQRLRTDSNPMAEIEIRIQDSGNGFQIAPMLLIPFIENAFKHGLSFKEPSYIKASLEIKEGTLYFDVYNSKHTRQDSDPEKDKGGIGLENVQERLKLLYPNKHELIIRDSNKEFSIHLTIQLANG